MQSSLRTGTFQFCTKKLQLARTAGPTGALRANHREAYCVDTLWVHFTCWQLTFRQARCRKQDRHVPQTTYGCSGSSTHLFVPFWTAGAMWGVWIRVGLQFQVGRACGRRARGVEVASLGRRLSRCPVHPRLCFSVRAAYRSSWGIIKPQLYVSRPTRSAPESRLVARAGRIHHGVFAHSILHGFSRDEELRGTLDSGEGDYVARSMRFCFFHLVR